MSKRKKKASKKKASKRKARARRKPDRSSANNLVLLEVVNLGPKLFGVRRAGELLDERFFTREQAQTRCEAGS